MASEPNDSPKKYYRSSIKAFESVVSLSNTKPGKYDRDEIRNDIETYSKVTSLGDRHEKGLNQIKGKLNQYKGTADQYPEHKGYGVVGQYGDGKTHFLTAVHDLLRNESNLVHPDEMNLLVLDPFDFPKNPADIVEALRERVESEIGPDAADRIPQVDTDKRAEMIEEMVEAGIPRERAKQIVEDKEISKIEGESAGAAFSEGCIETVKRETYDAIVFLIDEIEGIAREDEQIDYQDLDKYREFFDRISNETPVVMIMTAPRDQWNRFDELHQAMMDRAFGPEPRNHVELRPLNEEELAKTWSYRREQHLLRENVSPPSPAGDPSFPLHATALRSIYQIAENGDSNRTAIEMMKQGYNEFLQGETLFWVTPADILKRAVSLSAGDGDIFSESKFEEIEENDTLGVLLNIAGVLNETITPDELEEILDVPPKTIEDRADELENKGWINRRRSPESVKYQLTNSQLNELFSPRENTSSGGEIERTVEQVMANVSTDEEYLRRNLLTILRSVAPFSDFLIRGTHNDDDHYFVMRGTYGDFQDRRIVLTVGDHSEAHAQEIREDEDAELIIVINLTDHSYESNRIYSVETSPLTDEWEYLGDLNYDIEMAICGYRQLNNKLGEGAQALLNGIQSQVMNKVVRIDGYQFSDDIGSRLSKIYPTYPGPFALMNGNAHAAYETALDRRLSTETLDIDSIRDLGYADGRQAIENYIEDWLKYDLVTRADGIGGEVEIQTSESEQLILTAISDHDGEITQSDLYQVMRTEGYRRDDVDEFVNLLQLRGEVRQEGDTIQKTTNDLFDAQVFLTAVEEVVEWLTDDELPGQFREENVPDRDQLIGDRQACKKNLQQLSEQVDEKTASQIEELIKDIKELRDLAADTIDSIDNTTYAKKLASVGALTDEIREHGPEGDPTSSDYFQEVSALSSVGDNLATGARAYIDNNLNNSDDENVFSQLQLLRDEFIPEFREIGPYKKYDTPDEIEEVREQFKQHRPSTAELGSAVDAVTDLNDKIEQGKRLCNVAESVRGALLDIEEIERDEKELESDHELADKVREAYRCLEEAESEYKPLAERITDIGFGGLSSDRVTEIEDAENNIEEHLTEAKSKLDAVESQIKDETDELSTDVKQTRADVRSINSAVSLEHLGRIKAAPIREEARDWRDRFDTFGEEFESDCERVLDMRPSSVQELEQMLDRYDSYEETQARLQTFAEDLETIEEWYFDESEEDIPSGKLEDLESERATTLADAPTDRIRALLERIGKITDALEIDVAPLNERIREAIQPNGASPETLATEVPNDAYRETPAEVIEEINELIESGKLALSYDNGVVVRNQ